MFFSKLARLLAIAAFVIGVLTVAMGISAVTLNWGPEEIARYVGKSPGRNIDWGIYTIFASVALGTLAEISLSLRKWSA